MKKILSFVFFLLSQVCFAQNSDLKEQFSIFSIQDKKLGKVEFCTFNASIQKKKPLLLFIHGSGNLPNFHYRKDTKGYAWAAFSTLQKYKDDYHVIFVNKPAVPLFDTVVIDAKTHHINYPTSETFTQQYSLEWRAEAASLVINQAMKKLPVDKTKILVIGHSQGGQVAPKTAAINKHVTHVVLLNSNSLNHLYDFVLQERLAAFTGEQTFDVSQQNIDTLLNNYKAIFNEPLSRSKKWNEETYYRWASFSDETPLENMLKLKIPIYVVAGGKDIWGSFIMNTDYVAIEFLRHKKNNLTYKVYPNGNHFLQDEFQENGKTKTKDLKPMIFDDIMKWTEK